MSGFSMSEILSPIKQVTPMYMGHDETEQNLTTSIITRRDLTGDSGYITQVSSFTSSPQMAPPAGLSLPGYELYRQLQQSLSQEKHTTPWTLLAASSSLNNLDANSVSSRDHQLKMLFCDSNLNAVFPHQIRELQSVYEKEVCRLVSEHQLSLQSILLLPWLQQPIDFYYQNQHLSLIDRVQRSVSLLQSTLLVSPPLQELLINEGKFMTSTPKTQHKGKKCRKPLSERAVRIMEKWYTENEEHPYPSYDSCEVMAEAGEISVEQVKKWFANRRLRRKNTKNLTEIARRRKVARPALDIVSAAWAMSSN